ncbi:MAG TPA: DUF3387 domain-containing protein, partial [Solirubrobacterales bacterium]|nr:DUF3387 domain-containing protein [Solirubrobacterales bacterium]
SQSQNEIAEMEEAGLDITPHRRRMLEEDLDERFKDPENPLRLVFVCAMWMTGFDVPSCSTIYLDRPMRNHTLMQTIARANRVFPEKDNGLIVDYVGVFRRLEEALAIYAAARDDEEAGDVIRDKEELVAELELAVGELEEFCERWDIDLEALAKAKGFEFIALRDSSVEALLIDDVTRRSFLRRASLVRRLFAAILPDPAGSAHAGIVGVVRNLAETIRSLDPQPDVSQVAGEVQRLLDRSVGAEEYVIRAAADGADADALLDLNQIDFDALAARLAGKKRTAVQKLTGRLSGEIEAAAQRNPTRRSLVERMRTLIDQYNSGSLNVDEMLRRLQVLSRDLSEEERRTVTEGLTEPELAIFDLLTKPDPALTEDQEKAVKAVSKKLLDHIHEKLVLDWRMKAETREAARGMVKEILDELPDVYEPELWEAKTGLVFDHIFASYYDDGSSVYAGDMPPAGQLSPGMASPDLPGAEIDVETVKSDLLEKIRTDRAFAALVAEQLRGDEAFFAVETDDLIRGDETFEAEFKSTARWNLRDGCKDKRMEDAVVKSIAGFLNADGGTLLIGVADDGTIIGLNHDVPLVKPPNADGFVNWLTTHLINALSHSVAMRTKMRIDQFDEEQVCRVDVAASSVPVRARMSDGEEVFWVRMNNSTRAFPESEADAYIRDRW